MALVGSESPSAAYLAGQQHGTRLAVQHHVATQTAPKGAPATPTSLDAYLAQARALAQSDTAAQVQAIQRQQGSLRAQARQQAAQILAASQAAAQLQQGVGDKTATSYSDAAKLLSGLAQGFSGQAGQDATAAAAKVQQQLSDLGAPTGQGQGVIGTVQGNVAAQPDAIQNLLYNRGGYSPSTVLENAGEAFAAAQRQLPSSTLAYGQQQARGTIGAGNTQANNLGQQILDAHAGQPRLMQQYLAQIQSQLQSEALAQSLIGSRAASTNAQSGLNASGGTLPGYQTNPVTGSVDKVPPGYGFNGKGQVVKIGSSPTSKPLTGPQKIKYTGTANAFATDAFNGIPIYDSSGQPKTSGGKILYKHPPLSYAGAVAQAQKQGLLADPRVAALTVKALQKQFGGTPSSQIDRMAQLGIKPASGPALTKKQQATLNKALPLPFGS